MPKGQQVNVRLSESQLSALRGLVERMGRALGRSVSLSEAICAGLRLIEAYYPPGAEEQPVPDWLEPRGIPDQTKRPRGRPKKEREAGATAARRPRGRPRKSEPA